MYGSTLFYEIIKQKILNSHFFVDYTLLVTKSNVKDNKIKIRGERAIFMQGYHTFKKVAFILID